MLQTYDTLAVFQTLINHFDIQKRSGGAAKGKYPPFQKEKTLFKIRTSIHIVTLFYNKTKKYFEIL
jgi:hypothetical protein